MNLQVEQWVLAQSDQDDVIVLGPSPTDATFSAASTEGAYKILGVRPGLTISVFDMVIGTDFVGRFATEPCVTIDFLFEASGHGWLLDSDAEQRLSSIAAMRLTPPAQTIPPRDRRPLQRARNLMIAELARPWALDDLAREVGLTQKRLKSGFKGMYGLTAYAFLKEQRLLEARHLISSGEMNITQAAIAVGYSNPSHFSQLFLRRFGMQPSRVLAARSGERAP